MLVYAVKNKDGKYDMDCCDVNGNELFSSDISMSNWLYSEEDAKEFLYGDRCEIVPVTICEGDLEQVNKQIKENLIEMEHSKLRWENVCFKQEEEIKMLKEQLAIREKALELACGVIRQYVKIVYNDDADRLKGSLEDYYLQVAKYGVFKGEEYRIYKKKAKESSTISAKEDKE